MVSVLAGTCVIIMTHALANVPIYLRADAVVAMWTNEQKNAVIMLRGASSPVAVKEKVNDIIKVILEMHEESYCFAGGPKERIIIDERGKGKG